MKDKKKLIGIILGIIIVLAVIVGIITINKKTAPARELSKALDLGNKYLSELNYEEAVIAFNRVIEVDPMNVEAYVGAADAYMGLTNQNMPDDAEVNSARDEMISNLDPYNVSDGSEEKAKIEGFYAPALKYCEDALTILNSGYELTHDESIKAKIDEITELQSAITKMSDDMINAVMSELDAARTTDSDISSANIGDVVTFGTLDGQPVEWDVLDKTDGKALLISHYILDYHAYDQGETDVYHVKDTNWEVSEIRTWLNDEFINQLFDDRQIASIQETILQNSDWVEFYNKYGLLFVDRGTNPCGSTIDRMFLLSWEELIRYYGVIEIKDEEGWRALYSYAACCKDLEDDNSPWWTRSYGNKGTALGVMSDGYDGNYLVSGAMGVRPAIWVFY